MNIVLPIAGCFYTESLIFEINAIFAALFHIPLQLAAHVALANTSTFFYFIAVGVNVTCTTYIGISAGKNQPNAAVKYAKIGIGIMVLILIIEEFFFFIFRDAWSKAFGHDSELQSELLFLHTIYMILLVPDSLQNPFMGILKPLNKGGSALKSYGVIYYLFGLPFTYFLAFKLELWTVGLWIGFLVSVFINDLSLVYIMVRTDWKKEIEDIFDRENQNS